MTTEQQTTITPTRADELRAEIAELDETIRDQEREISGYQFEIEFLENQVSDLEAERDGLEADLAALEPREQDDDEPDPDFVAEVERLLEQEGEQK
jgi:chromosome segregation ATPase